MNHTFVNNTDTYLTNCLREGYVVRWQANNTPIKVYIAPFRWYEAEKQRNAQAYMNLAWDSFNAWTFQTGGLVRFQRVQTLIESQINLLWRRVDRKSLGHCKTEWDKRGRIFGAEISIGLSDGLLFAQYNNPVEVKHTILHEIGHALGILGHSPYPEDMMYVPHQFGIGDLSPRDTTTLYWLYQLPIGYHIPTEANRLGLGAKASMAEFLTHWQAERAEGFKTALQAVQNNTEQAKTPLHANAPVIAKPSINTTGHLTMSIEEQQALLSQMGQFYLATSPLLPAKIQPTAPKKPDAPLPQFQQFKWSGE